LTEHFNLGNKNPERSSVFPHRKIFPQCSEFAPHLTTRAKKVTPFAKNKQLLTSVLLEKYHLQKERLSRKKKVGLFESFKKKLFFLTNFFEVSKVQKKDFRKQLLPDFHTLKQLHFKKLLTLAQEKKNIKNYTQKKEIDFQKNFRLEIQKGKKFAFPPKYYTCIKLFHKPKAKKK